MQYYLQLEGQDKKFRLQTDKSWRLIVSKEILESDLLSTNEVEFINIQKSNSTITVDNMKYFPNPISDGVKNENNEKLSYESYVFRETKPTLPSRNQLISIIANGNDNVNQSIVLRANSQFDIVPFDNINISIKYPSIVARNPTFIAGNDYVGVDASEDNQLIDEIYNQSLECWHAHLLKGITNMYADDMMRERKTEEVIAEINSFEM